MNTANNSIEKKAKELAIQKAARQTSSSGGVGRDTNYVDNDKSYLNFKTLEEFNDYERKRTSNR